MVDLSFIVCVCVCVCGGGTTDIAGMGGGSFCSGWGGAVIVMMCLVCGTAVTGEFWSGGTLNRKDVFNNRPGSIDGGTH